MTQPTRRLGEDTSAPFDAVVIGGGQGGLAMAWHLAQTGARFVVLDAGSEVGHVWRSRWDSLTLFTPAEYDALPGMPFPARPGTYPTKDQVADYLRAYCQAFELPVRLNSPVTRLRRREDGLFEVTTPTGNLVARQVVIATGPFQQPHIPVIGSGLSPDVAQLHSTGYRNPEELPDGRVLIVGAGNSGLQIAQELSATRRVTVAVGNRPPTLPQRLLGKDLFWWMDRLRLMGRTADSRIARRVRARGDLVIGTRWRQLRKLGVEQRPRLTGAHGRIVEFDDGTTQEIDAVVWATGFRSDYSWLQVPGVVIDGHVAHRRGITQVPGLSFLGLAWQHTRGSALLGFVKDDAAWLADQLTLTRATSTAAGR